MASPTLRYGIAVLSVCLAALLRWELNGFFGHTSSNTPYITFYLAITVAAMAGGVGPTLLATALGAAAGLWLFAPPGTVTLGSAPSAVRLLLYLATGLGCAALSGWWHAARRRLVQQSEQAQDASERLRQVGERFRAVFEQAAIGMGLVKFTDARWIDVNDAFCRMLGYSRQEFRATPWPRITHPDDVDLDMIPFRRMAAGELDSYTVEKRFIHKDGHHVWSRLTLSLVRDAQGRPDYEIAIVEDISEQNKAEKAQAMLAAVVASSADAIIGESLDGTILSWNAGAERLFGYSAEEAVGRPIAMLVPENQTPSEAEHIQTILAGRTVQRHAVERVRKDGSRLFVSLSISPIRDAAGRIVGIAKLAHDITDMKQAQEQLKAAMRSAETAKAAAEAANQAKDHFLAVLSHELRTPLTPVMTTASLLERDAQLPDRYREDVEMIRRNVEVEARLIDDLLDVTRIARGKIELDLQPVAICDVIRRAAEVCRPDIEAKRLHFGLDLPVGPPDIVEADPARLQQVFWNLIKNAIKFTRHDGCIGIRCRRDEGGHVIAEVSDSGEGIDSAVLPHIFNAFEQGGRKTTRQFGGLGLGLTITRGLVEKHGGSIEAFSAGKGQGATFRVTLPLLSRAHAAPPAPEARPQAAHEPAERHGLRILLVEDHSDTARIMRRLLMMEGHEVEIAGDVATALELAATRQFNLLISDLGLPDGSGVDLIHALREHGRQLPAIALSGYGQEQDIQRTRAAGFAAHLTKPVNPERLSATIATVAAEPAPSFRA